MIMISDKLPNGEWGEPYVILPVPNRGYLSGVYLSPNGNKVYVGWNGNLGVIENLGGKKWGVMLNLESPLVTEAQEDRPAISLTEDRLFFMRSIRKKDSNVWWETPFESKRNESGQWSNPVQLNVALPSEHIEECVPSENGDVVVYSISNGPSNRNYYVRRTENGFSPPVEMDITNARFTWVSSDCRVALANVYTAFSRSIALVTFKNGLYGDQIPSQLQASRSDVDEPTPAAPVKPSGKYIGLLIGVSNYADNSLNLEHPVSDAKKMRDVLRDQYGFESIRVLENPTRQQIISELYNLRSQIGQYDNLLIFFAGHGYWDKSAEQGYWWPTDARPNDPANWLSNSDLREQIRGIKSAHTLLISDACFSGGIFRSRGVNDIQQASLGIQQLYATRSRRAMTSGNMSSVPDRSVFLKYLVEKLENNNEKFLTAQMLFNGVRMAVMNNGIQNPQEGAIMDAGDEGGDFVFVRSKNPK